MPTITQLTSARGTPSANHYCITEGNSRVLQSYESRVAKVEDGEIYLTPKWNISATTFRNLKIFLGVTWSKDDIRERIESGLITVVDEV